MKKNDGTEPNSFFSVYLHYIDMLSFQPTYIQFFPSFVNLYYYVIHLSHLYYYYCSSFILFCYICIKRTICLLKDTSFVCPFILTFKKYIRGWAITIKFFGTCPNKYVYLFSVNATFSVSIVFVLHEMKIYFWWYGLDVLIVTIIIK